MPEQKVNPHLYAIVVGEMSGDTLGAGLMKAILRHDPQAKFVGIGGPKMIKCGFKSAFNMEELSVMGIAEVVSHLVPILRIRRKITNILLKLRPCVMIGIDSPDFNLAVEHKLKKANIKTIHYVSPSVWAWREGRMKTIRASCDEVLALLPFEKEFYDQVGMPCTYVGHSLANSIAIEVSQKKARERIALQKSCVDGVGSKVLAILPGSRRGVISRMLPEYAKAARIMREQIKDLTLITVAPNYDIAVFIKDLWLRFAPDISLTVFVGNSQDVIASADVCLVTSGTVAFEAMLLKVPMVVAYKVSFLSACIARCLLKINVFSLPNLLAKKEIVKELIQDNCTPAQLAYETMSLLNNENLLMKKEFELIHKSIRTNSDELAAKVVFRLISEIPQENLQLDQDALDLEQSISHALAHNHQNASDYEEKYSINEEKEYFIEGGLKEENNKNDATSKVEDSSILNTSQASSSDATDSSKLSEDQSKANNEEKSEDSTQKEDDSLNNKEESLQQEKEQTENNKAASSDDNKKESDKKSTENKDDLKQKEDQNDVEEAQVKVVVHHKGSRKRKNSKNHKKS